MSKAPKEMNIRPKKFQASIGGFFGPSYEVELQSDGTLLYVDDPYDFPAPGYEREGITVSEDQWREFRKALDRANVWEWKEYYDSDILDGTQWELVIKYEGMRPYIQAAATTIRLKRNSNSLRSL